MYEDIMRRPMFQKPQQRAGSGIMAGVAPVQGYDDGGSVPQYTPKFLREEEEEDITDNPYFKAFVVDKDDPVDIALSTAAAGMAATGIGSPVAAVTKLVGIARKIGKNRKVIGDIVERAQDKVMQMESMGVFDKAKKIGGQAATKVGDYLTLSSGLKEIPEIISGPAGYVEDRVESVKYPIEQGSELVESIYNIATKADGGIASLPVNMADGGIGKTDLILKGFGDLIKFIKNKLKKGEINEDEAKKIIKDNVGGPKPRVQYNADGTPRIKSDGPSRGVKEDLKGKPDEPKPLPSDDLTKGKGKRSVMSTLTAPLRNPGKTLFGVGATGTAAIVGDAILNEGKITKDLIGIEDEIMPPPPLASQTPPPPLASQTPLARINPNASTSVGKEDGKVKEERKKFLPKVRPFGGKIAKALLGEDEAFGGDDKKDQGFLRSVMSKLQDPRTRYAIAKANQPSEGFTPRNAMSDMVLGAQEYDDAVAKREYIQAQTEDQSTSDLEKLTDFFMSDVDTEGRDEEEILSLRNKMKFSLQSLSFDQTRQALAAELAAKFGSDDVGIDTVKKIMNQLTSTEDLAKIIEDFNLAGQAAP